MTVTGQAGRVAIAPQITKYGAGAYDPTALTWTNFKATGVDFGAVQAQRTLPLEVGGSIVPTGSYKAGASVGGGFGLQPRLQDDLGWLLFAMMGDVTTLAGDGANGAEVGAYMHDFQPLITDHTHFKWLSVRKWVPGSVAANSFGELGYDCVPVNMQLNLPQANILTARADFMGRIPLFYENPGSGDWGAASTPEDFQSIPITCSGSFTLAGTAYPITDAQVVWSNNFTTPDEEMILGSYYADDFAPRTRSMSIRFTYKWANPDFYQQLMTNSSTGTTWDPTVFLSDTSGSDFGLEINVKSAATMPALTGNYEMYIRANRVALAVGGPPALAPGGIVTLPLIATVLEPSTPASEDYAIIRIINKTASYVWPT